LNYAVTFYADTVTQGIGTSRRETQKQYAGQSPFVHSWATHRRYLDSINQFKNFSQAHGINRVDRLDTTIRDAWLREKIRYGVSENTIKNDICALNKFMATIGRSDLKITSHGEWKAQAAAAGRATPYSNPDRVLNNLDGIDKTIAQLQYLTGARISEVREMILNGESSTVHLDGKNGKERDVSFVDRQDVFERITDLKTQLEGQIQTAKVYSVSWHEIRTSYYEELHKACDRAGEDYNGSHDFRATYADERFTELYNGYVAEGMDSDAAESIADKETSLELGHNREDVTRHYRHG
jgi:integrase